MAFGHRASFLNSLQMGWEDGLWTIRDKVAFSHRLSQNTPPMGGVLEYQTHGKLDKPRRETLGL